MGGGTTKRDRGGFFFPRKMGAGKGFSHEGRAQQIVR